MSQISNGQDKALRLILLNYANDENTTAHEAISAILSILGCDREQATLRDQFAMAALQGLMASNWQDVPYPEGYGEQAYKVADAMMKARSA